MMTMRLICDSATLERMTPASALPRSCSTDLKTAV